MVPRTSQCMSCGGLSRQSSLYPQCSRMCPRTPPKTTTTTFQCMHLQHRLQGSQKYTLTSQPTQCMGRMHAARLLHHLMTPQPQQHDLNRSQSTVAATLSLYWRSLLDTSTFSLLTVSHAAHACVCCLLGTPQPHPPEHSLLDFPAPQKCASPPPTPINHNNHNAPGSLTHPTLWHTAPPLTPNPLQTSTVSIEVATDVLPPVPPPSQAIFHPPLTPLQPTPVSHPYPMPPPPPPAPSITKQHYNSRLQVSLISTLGIPVILGAHGGRYGAAKSATR